MISVILNSILLLFVLINAFTMPKLAQSIAVSKSVAVHIPMRNEAKNVLELVESLRSQNYAGQLHFYILDDNSTDQTYSLLQSATKDDPRFTLLVGSEPPKGWIGKTWALQQIFEASSEEVIISLDADVRLTTDAITRGVSTLSEYKLNFLSVYPSQITTTFGERMIQPLLQWSWLSTLLLRFTMRSTRPAFAVANGQFFIVQRQVMTGYANVKKEVLDDMALARTLLASKFRGSVVNGGAIAQCQMYASFSELRSGYAKSLWKAFGSVIGSLIAIIFLFISGVLPIILVLTGSPWGWIALELVVLSRIISAYISDGAMMDSLLHPISSLLLIYLIIYSWSVRKSVQWKGRTL